MAFIENSADHLESATSSSSMKTVDSSAAVISPALGLISRLCKTLAWEGVSYCHWKSNAALDKSASGDNDLDLLIHRADMQRFTGILYRYGFKEARPHPDRELPGVLNYYGYDADSEKFVHVHAHYQLILGDDATKNYRLPIEGPYLGSAVQGELFKVPSVEFELIIFVIRMMLKHSAWDSIFSFHGALSPSARRELAFLTARVDRTRMHAILQQDLPFLDGDLFERCLHSLSPDAAFISRYRVGRRLHRQLQAHARRAPLLDTYLKLWRRTIWGVRRYIFRQKSRKNLIQGGAIIAVVGGDGAGKSTAVNELNSWLSKTFVTTHVHLGKPHWSLSTWLIKILLKVGWRHVDFSRREIFALASEPSQALVVPGYPWLIWHVLTARDRYRTYVKARRFASNGGLVICDRFPLPQIKSMDGAQTRRATTAMGTSKPLINFLVNLEEKFYRQMLLPDVLIVMKVDPEIAVQRRADEDPDWIRNRSKEIWNLDWQQTPVHIIDAGQPKEEMLATLKSLVWSRL